MKFWTLVLASALVFTGINAEAAKRMGGGKSMGQQSGNVTQREATKNQPPAGEKPAQAATNNVAKPGAAPTPQRKPWGAMLGGIAAGLGLAWLASSLGLGEAFGQFLLIALLALVVMVVVGMVMRRRAGPGALAMQGAGPTTPQFVNSYKPENVGNDASARPWERNSMAFKAPPGHSGVFSGIGSGLTRPNPLEGSQNWGIPAGFDIEGFLYAAKNNFVTLQDAWDRNDLPTLRSMMTDDMLRDIKVQLTEREAHTGGSVNKTDVAVLDAKLLGIEDLDLTYLASVEFSGMIREDPSAGPAPFREVWNMTKPKDGSSGWLVAGLQALQ
jgi:predicted lipid-binding transport protein (Tim44 family)